jgi:uncharacterized protein
MLLSFSVGNYRSFLQEQTLSLIASKRLADHHDSHAVPLPNTEERALRTAVIYGANGAGKSNLFKAVEYLQDAATRPRRKGTGTKREAFKFSPAGAEPSQFDIQFVVNDDILRFGLVIDDQRIVEEWLIRVKGKKEHVVYERVTSDTGDVEVKVSGGKKAGEKIQAIATVGGPPNQSFLATIIENLDAEDMPKSIRDTAHWLQHQLMIVRPDGPVAPIGHYMNEDKEFAEFAGKFLKSSSTGVESLNVAREEITVDQLQALIGKRGFSLFKDQIENMQVGEGTILGNGVNEFVIERAQEQHFYKLSVEASHQCADGTTVNLAFKDESDGTRRLLDLLPAIHDGDLDKPKVFFIDEIERSLHPALMKRYMEYFLNASSDVAGQMIVSTHESHLLDLDLLRRDEIWFAEKGHGLETNLYSLSQFKIRTDLELRKNYFAGRFGGIPFLGDIDKLQPSDKDEEAIRSVDTRLEVSDQGRV